MPIPNEPIYQVITMNDSFVIYEGSYEECELYLERYKLQYVDIVRKSKPYLLPDYDEDVAPDEMIKYGGDYIDVF